MWAFIGSNAAIIIALCAVFVAVYQATATRRHSRLSVRPHLAIFVTRRHDPKSGELEINLINNGLGPAFIKSYDVLVDGSRVDTHAPGKSDAALKEVYKGPYEESSVTNLGNTYAISKDEKKNLLTLRFPAKSLAEFEETEKEVNRISWVVTYSSIYEENFTLEYRKK